MSIFKIGEFIVLVPKVWFRLYLGTWDFKLNNFTNVAIVSNLSPSVSFSANFLGNKKIDIIVKRL